MFQQGNNTPLIRSANKLTWEGQTQGCPGDTIDWTQDDPWLKGQAGTTWGGEIHVNHVFKHVC